MSFVSGLVPYSDAERERDEAEKRTLLQRALLLRMICKGRYDLPGSLASKRRDDRMLGESADSRS